MVTLKGHPPRNRTLRKVFPYASEIKKDMNPKGTPPNRAGSHPDTKASEASGETEVRYEG